MSSWEKFFKNPTDGRFSGSPASLLLVSIAAFSFAISSIHNVHLVLVQHGTSLPSRLPRSFYAIVLVSLAVGIGALYSSWVAWKKHDDR